MPDVKSHIIMDDSVEESMCSWLERLCEVNTHTLNLVGLEQQAELLCQRFANLNATVRKVAITPWQTIDKQGKLQHLPLGKTLLFKKRPEAPIQVFLSGHMDTVYPADCDFQAIQKQTNKRWKGPGVSDMKGGLLVMHQALTLLEASPFADNIGWTVMINPDEEIGSVGSQAIINQEASGCDYALVFEPALDANGTMVSTRKGSGKFTITAKGVAAHVGRAFHDGENAIHLIAKVITEISRIDIPGVIINVGKISGGSAVNVVPAHAKIDCDIRVDNAEQAQALTQALEAIIQSNSERLALHGKFWRPAKPMSDALNTLMSLYANAGKALGIDIVYQHSGGCCDGNNLSALGMPTLDTLGVCGGAIHSPDEFICIDSLIERAALAAMLLMALSHTKPNREKFS